MSSVTKPALPALLLSLLLAGVLPGAAGGQTTRSARGQIRDAAGAPIGGAQLRATGTATGTATGAAPATVARAESGTDGRFLVAGVPAGATFLVARRLGYRPDSIALADVAGGNAELTIVMERVAVALVPVRVTSRRVVDGPMAGFYQRKEQSSGRFFTREEIERRNPSRMTDLLRMIPGMRIGNRPTAVNTVRVRGARCAPQYWLDGTPLAPGVEFDIDAINPRSLDGMEVYSGPASVPIEFQRDRTGNSSCGTVLLWTARGGRHDDESRRGGASPASRVALLVEERRAWTAADVDVPARVDSTRLVRAGYPDSLHVAGVAGHVLAEFVVDAAGEVQLETFSAITSSHRAFVDAVRDVLREQRFIPAVRQGVPVSQVVQLPFQFTPEGSSGRRR